MSHTFTQFDYHIVWSTKNREPMINELIEERLHEYLGGSFKTKGCIPKQIGGMPDHIHCLVSIPPTLCISEVIRNVKVGVTKWVHQTFPECAHFAWQEGYGGFCVANENRQAMINYIKNQKEHHKKRDFKAEFLLLLKKHEIEFKEEYLWK